MDNITAHNQWLRPASLEEAAQVQKELASRVSSQDELDVVRRVAGVDVSCNVRDPSNRVYAAIVGLDVDTLRVVETVSVERREDFPYVPGFLGFRETPCLIEAFSRLNQRPDLMMVDGHGVSHPRGLGIASHLGVLLNCPTIGVAKSILVGKPDGEPGPNPGDHVPLMWKGRQIGVALRTKVRTNPLYISIGHKITLEKAIEWVLRCGKGYRLPEPTRQAHLAANACRKEFLSSRGLTLG